MSQAVAALVAHAGSVPADARKSLADTLREHLSGENGVLLLETCHRVELYGEERLIADLGAGQLPAGVTHLHGRALAVHLLRLAVGRQSAVIAEDQLLHQLRSAVQHARAAGPLPVELDRLCDISLRAGRRARSWLPSRRPSLAEVALERVLHGTGSAQPSPFGAIPEPVLVVGAGEMGRRAARSLIQRGIPPLLTSRTPERAAGLAGRLNLRNVPFDPGPELARVLHGAVLALSGKWPLSEATQAALLESGAWLVDLSAPSCLPERLAGELGPRLLTIDELAAVPAAAQPSAVLLERLDGLVDESLAEYDAWSAQETQRGAARALARKAHAARAAELDALWRRLPQLGPDQREEVERMARHLTERLLRDPLERLQQDGDGRHASAARELFRL